MLPTPPARRTLSLLARNLAGALSLLTLTGGAGAQTLTPLRTLRGHTNEVGVVAFSPDARVLASGSSEFESMDGTPGEIKLWDAKTGRLRHTLNDHYRWVSDLAFSPDGKTLAAGDVDGDDGSEDVCLWDVQTGHLKRRLSASAPVAFSLDGRMLATGGQGTVAGDGSNYTPITLRDAATGTVRRRLSPRGLLDSLAFSPDGTVLVSGSDLYAKGEVAAGRVQVWDALTGRLSRTLASKTGVSSEAYAPDGRSRAAIVGIGDDDRGSAIEIYDARTGRVLHVLRPKDAVYGFAFTSDSRTLLSGSGGSVEDKPMHGMLTLWDVGTGRLLRSYPQKSPVLSVAVSADYTAVATGMGDDTVKLWRLKE